MRTIIKEIIAPLFVGSVLILIIIWIMFAIENKNETNCLTSAQPRRWAAGVCEEYQNEHWSAADSVYNDAGNKVLEQR